MLFSDGISFADTRFEIISGHKYGDFADEIEMKVTTNITALIIDRGATIEYLTREFRGKLLDGSEKELAIHNETLRIEHVVFQSEDGNSVRATMKLDASKTFDFENPVNPLVKKLKKQIL